MHEELLGELLAGEDMQLAAEAHDLDPPDVLWGQIRAGRGGSQEVETWEVPPGDFNLRLSMKSNGV